MNVVALFSQKGGAGKTTLAINLAVAAQQAGLTVALIDLDQQKSSVAWSGLRKADTPVVVSKTPDQLAAVLDAAREHQGDIVVLDTPPLSSGKEMKVLRQADLALIPCRASALDLLSIGASVSLANLAKVKKFVVLSSVPARGQLVRDAREALKTYAVESAPPVVCQRVAHVRAYTTGQSVLEYEPNGKAAEEIRALYNWTTEQLRK